MKTFKYKNYANCYFIVGTYLKNKSAMAITIGNDDGPISTCTIYDDFVFYCEGITTIKNYGENSHMTNFLKKLGIVDEVLESYPCNYNFINPSETKDVCLINMDKLKQYCKKWDYNV